MAKIPDFGKIIGEVFSVALKFFDEAYQEGWLWIFLGGVIVFVIVIMVFG